MDSVPATKSANQRKSEKLGIPFGTACSRLRKLVLFSLLLKLEENVCFVCEGPILTADEMTIEHKRPWLNADAELSSTEPPAGIEPAPQPLQRVAPGRRTGARGTGRGALIRPSSLKVSVDGGDLLRYDDKLNL